IVAFQAIHYLILALILPVCLSTLASDPLLAYEGGSSSISLAMDWRAFTGRTVSGLAAGRVLSPGLTHLAAAATASATARRVAKAATDPVTADVLRQGVVRVVEWDAMRGWAVALAWMATSLVDIVYIYHFIRRPTHILDFSLTLLFNHTILTTYYSHAFPSSLFYWSVLAVSVVAQIVAAEQMCVRREMREGFSVADMTPALGATAQLAGAPMHGGVASGRTPSLAVPRDRFANVIEMGSVGGGTKSSSGKEYERLPMDER
ncbi:hypothetical protein JCM10212_001304, partial [Sporobolomyces blumeae]